MSLQTRRSTVTGWNKSHHVSGIWSLKFSKRKSGRGEGERREIEIEIVCLGENRREPGMEKGKERVGEGARERGSEGARARERTRARARERKRAQE